jgi:hypothetical protein
LSGEGVEGLLLLLLLLLRGCAVTFFVVVDVAVGVPGDLVFL